MLFRSVSQSRYSNIMQQFLTRRCAAALFSHGDDTLLVYIDGDDVIMMESDLSSCDRSLTKKSLTFERDLINFCLTCAGSDPKFRRANQVAFNLNFAERRIDDLRVSLDGDAQRPTGCTRTSLMNTVLTAYPMLKYHFDTHRSDWVRLLDYNPEPYSAYYKAHGFDAKIKMHRGSRHNFPTGSFLKGVWLHTDCDTIAWTRLPSMAIKMFKTLKPLPTLTKKYRKEKVALPEARRRYCVMIASSWRHFDLPLGIREWVDKWADKDTNLPLLPTGSRVESGGVVRYTFRNQRALIALAEHYHVDVDMYVDWSLKFMDLKPGQGHCHPMWIALGADY